jgi:hypothetical protein
MAAGGAGRPEAQVETQSRNLRGLLVGAGVLVWAVGLVWVLNRKGIIETPSFSGPTFANDDDDVAAPPAPDEPRPGAPINEELVIETRHEPKPAPVSATPTLDDALAQPLEPDGPPTYPVWFESERSIGVCRVSYEGGSKLANLHVATRLPEGPLEFTYVCGKYRGRGSIDVKPKRVNGVLFCEDAGGVSVKTVRSKDGRCAR